MTDSKLKWGILGTGRICRKVIPAINNAPHSMAYAIASRSMETAKEAALKYNIPNAYGSYEELLLNKEIQVVYIALPNSFHLEWVKKAAEAKKHVLCEKPLGLSVEEVTEAQNICKENGVKLLEGYMWPHHPRTQEIKKILKSGRLGKVSHVEAALNFLLNDEHGKIRVTQELGGGCLFDIGCYCIYGILWALEEMPKNIFASHRIEKDVDTEVTALLEFKNKVTATFHCSFNHSYRAFLEVVGAKATLRVPQMWNPFSLNHAEIWENGELKETITFEKADQVLAMVENFNEFILNNKTLPVSSESSLNILKVIEAVSESAWTEEKISC